MPRIGPAPTRSDRHQHMTVCLVFEQRFGKALDMDAITTATSIRALAALVP